MDINTLRGISTIFVMIAFISVTLWAYSSSRKNRFEEDGNLPFEDDEIDQRTLNTTEKKNNE